MSTTTTSNDDSNVTEINSSAFDDIEAWELPDSLQNPGQLSLRQQNGDGKRYVIVDTRQSTATAVTRTSGFENDVQLRFEAVDQAIAAALQLVSDDEDDDESDDDTASESDDSESDSDPLDDSDDSEPVSDDSDDDSDEASTDDLPDSDDEADSDESDESDDEPTGEAALSDDVLATIENDDQPWQNETVLRAVLDAFDQKSHMALLLGCAPPTVRKWELRLD
jgi:cobalamin biosynthesis protein CobT